MLRMQRTAISHEHDVAAAEVKCFPMQRKVAHAAQKSAENVAKRLAVMDAFFPTEWCAIDRAASASDVVASVIDRVVGN